MFDIILHAYGLDPGSSVESISTGLINKTWKIISGKETFIVQRINTHVFNDPSRLSENTDLIAAHVSANCPGYLLVTPYMNRDQKSLTVLNGKYFRLTPYVHNSVTIDRVTHAEQAYEAALQFGTFTTMLAGFDSRKLYHVIPNFHNLTLRYRQFEQAILHGDPERVQQSKEIIEQLKSFSELVIEYERINTSNNFFKRVTHHDTKISNVLFNQQAKGICVIDLDTVMPGYYISDVGDMLRTYLSPTTEEEKDFSRIGIREDVFEGIVAGYLSAMGNQLSTEEKEHFTYSGLFLTYMQALRFITDFMQLDVYYGADYEHHNLDRAANQLTLLQCIEEQKQKLQNIVRRDSKNNYAL